MSRRDLTVGRFEDVKRFLRDGLSKRKIALITGCSRNTVRSIATGERESPLHDKKPDRSPAWSDLINWTMIKERVGEGDTLKDLWRLHYPELTTYDSFRRQMYRKFPYLQGKLEIHRYFEPGDYCEVDYMGMTVEYADTSTGDVFESSVFIGILNHSQLIYADAREDMKSRSFLECHVGMFNYFGGVTSVTVCDCLKQGVTKAHIYDPYLNESYREFATVYGTAIVPARVRRPQDKGLVENAVKYVQRVFKLFYRGHTFTSVKEINEALSKVITVINEERKHTRFKTTRRQRYEETERNELEPLPSTAWEYYEWKVCKVHADSHISVMGNYYSVPHIHRYTDVKAKISSKTIEIFKDLERLAVHGRNRDKLGKRITDMSHMPENAKAYYEATPRSILSQARNISPKLHEIVDKMFQENALGHLRRAQGLISLSRKELSISGDEHGVLIIEESITDMNRFNKTDYHSYKNLLIRYRKQTHETEDQEIRRSYNPHLRYSNVIDFKKTMEVNVNGSITSEEPNARA